MEYDLIERLRCNYGGIDFSGPAPTGMVLPTGIMLESANEIETLRAALTTLRESITLAAAPLGITGEPEAVVEALVVEVAAQRGRIRRQSERLCILEGATNHAGGTPLSQALREVESLRAQLLTAREQAEERRNLLEDVVNALDLSEAAIEEHGPMGTPPATLVRLVLEQKDRQIAMLKAGMKQIPAGDDILTAREQGRREALADAITAVRHLWPDTEMGQRHAKPFTEAILRALSPKGEVCEEEATDDPSPYCQYCGAQRKETCKCGPIADNH